MPEFMVVYRVRFSEEWCADACPWLEESGAVRAPTAHAARRLFRDDLRRSYRRVVVGRHVSTRRVRGPAGRSV